jgi:hypothetical protein
MNTIQRYQQVSTQDFLALGVNHLAYIKPTEVDGQPLFAVHAADGTQIALMPNRDRAVGAVRQNDMEPHSIH